MSSSRDAAVFSRCVVIVAGAFERTARFADFDMPAWGPSAADSYSQVVGAAVARLWGVSAFPKPLRQSGLSLRGCPSVYNTVRTIRSVQAERLLGSEGIHPHGSLERKTMRGSIKGWWASAVGCVGLFFSVAASGAAPPAVDFELGAIVMAAQNDAERQIELKVGDPAPDVELEGSDGKTYRLTDFRGKQAVVIAWFPRAFTPGCTAQCKAFARDGDELKQFDVAYFTASCDTQEKNAKFAESVGADYPILADPEGKAARAFGVLPPGKQTASRWTFIIGKDGKIATIDKSVNTANHAKDVAARLAELGVAKRAR